MKPNVLIFSGYGLNCEEETAYAFTTAGGQADIVHINDVIAGAKKLSDYQILTFPGGFSYGDDTGSGNAYANKLRNHIWKDLEQFVQQDRLIIGICNGFQILVNLGLLSTNEKAYGERKVALLHNDSARYTVRWVDLQINKNSASPWLKNITELSLPIAHGEGKLYASEKTLKDIEQKNMISMSYINGAMCEYQDLPANPNGSIHDIASMTDISGKILGLMPHPERALFFTQQPNWPYLKEKYLREKKELPEYGPGLQLFKNAINYFL